MVLNELHGGGKVRLVELVGYIPAERAELASLLHGRVQEGNAEEHGLPLRQRADVENVLRERGVRALETGLDALRRLVGELDGGLEEIDGELGMRFGSDSAAEGLVDLIGRIVSMRNS